MKERPILFQTDMVKALLDGRKTQTRRTIKPQPISLDNYCGQNPGFVGFSNDKSGNKVSAIQCNGLQMVINCPYGKPGDLLWVRETWGKIGTVEIFSGRKSEHVVYKAGPHPFKKDVPHLWTPGADKWKPSIHMPYAACRIFLQVKEIRVERLQDISEEDAKAEGVITPLIDQGVLGTDDSYVVPNKNIETEFNVKGSWKTGFKQIINQINGLDTWDRNPWVWVVKFEVISTTGRAAAYAKLGKEVPV